MFEEHLRTLNSNNPLHKLLNSGGRFNSNKLLFRLSKDKRYEEYMRAVDEPSKTALHGYLLGLRREFIYRKEGFSSVMYPENLELVPWSIAPYLHRSKVKECFYPGELEGFCCDTSVYVVSDGIADI